MASPSIVGTAGGQAGLSPVRAFLAARRIGPVTSAKMGVGSDTVFFPDLGCKAKAVTFEYENGWKARAIEEKAHVASKGIKLTFWNLAAVLRASPAVVYITEGELDACALVEAGISHEQVLSVPNGAREKPVDAPLDQRGYSYILDALKAGLSRTKQFIWCGDQDDPGHVLRADVARILGAARFWFVDWPEGVKDANEMLISDGPAAVYDQVSHGALPWPVDGIYRLLELPEPAPLTIWKPGFVEWENKMALAARTLSVVTGQPGHGKTELWTQIWFQVCKAYDVPIAVASFETTPKPYLRRQLRTLISGKLQKDMSDEDIKKADAWINERYLFLVHPGQRQTLEWYLDMAEVAVVRHGARVVMLDPWNRVEGSRTRDETETEYIARCLRTVHGFANDMNCHMQIVAHPAKSERGYRGKVPELEDISGSKHWDNMPDQGSVVFRKAMYEGGERRTGAVLYHRKARFAELGYPCELHLNYRLDLGRFVSTDYTI